MYNQKVGHKITIWQYCVVLAGAKIGSDCNISYTKLIQTFLKIL